MIRKQRPSCDLSQVDSALCESRVNRFCVEPDAVRSLPQSKKKPPAVDAGGEKTGLVARLRAQSFGLTVLSIQSRKARTLV